MAADEIPRLGELRYFSIDQEVRSGEFPRAETRVVAEDRDSAVHVHHRIALGRSVGSGNVVELIEMIVQGFRCRLEQSRPLVEVRFPQRRATAGMGVVDHGFEVDALAIDGSDFFPGDGVSKNPSLAFAGVPLAACVALQCDHR